MRAQCISLVCATAIACGPRDGNDTDTADTDTADTDTADTDTAGNDTAAHSDPPDCAVERALAEDPYARIPDCYEWPAWPAFCGEGGRDRTLVQDGLLWMSSGSFDNFSGIGGGPFTITDEASWQAFLDDWGSELPTLAEVDFDTHIVAVLQHYIGGTCGAGVADHGFDVDIIPEAPAHLVLEIYDLSGACAEHCDMGFAQFAIYAVPRDDLWPVMCVEVFDTCTPT